ncbi:hypothetical protein AAC978_05280 [Desulfitobacterium sp. THU1]|uniref:hypothetical protein n=1 Tax=Desulfitobacterium sp. THU1 TaxID=3138072 RepID=UPI00311D4D7C
MNCTKRRSKVLLLALLVLTLCVVVLVGCQSQPTNQPADTTAPVASPVAEETGDKTVQGFPPPITHGLEGKENCASCHNEGIGGAPKTSHPELSVCRQCHV